MNIQVPGVTTNWLKEVYGFIKNEYYEIYFNGEGYIVIQKGCDPFYFGRDGEIEFLE